MKDCDVPLGSVLGPDLNTDFTRPLGDLIRHYDIIPSFYADNSQKYIHFNPNSNVDVQDAVSKMELCCAKVRIWITTNIGVDINLGLKLEKQVNNMVSSGWYHLSNISRVRKYFTQEATEAFVHALLCIKLDAYNSILAGIPTFQLQKLQKIPNTAVKLVVQAPKFDSAAKIRKELHWLPIPHCIQYKLNFSCINRYTDKV